MLTFNFNPFPKLETDRLVLRRLESDDAEDYFAIRSDQRVMEYLARPRAKSREDALAVIRSTWQMLDTNEGICWGLALKDTAKLIGTIGYYRSQPQNHRSEIGYEMHPDFWGRGIMSEALRAALDYGFHQMNLHSVAADIDPANLKSAKILQRHHFIKEAHFRENCFFEGKFIDSAIYSLLRSRHVAMNHQ